MDIEKKMLREPAVAGQFYSGDRATLLQDVRSLIQTRENPLDARAIVVPHAGYIYSGAVAGLVYGSIRLSKRFIFLGPNHTGLGVPFSIYPAGQWRTPLGLASIDVDLNERLLRESPLLREDRLAHLREHCLEVQIPFLQTLVPDFKFSAICVGTGDSSLLQQLGHAIARVQSEIEDPVLLVASSDMNHFESAEVSAIKDRIAIERMIDVDPEGLFRVVEEKRISMCGFAPAVATLVACRDLGCTRGQLIRYTNSGEVSGDYKRVVGYAGMAIV
jgi:AmmeMemoRadiSam system protein B